nr:RNA pseudouridine synthase 6, chloroplastic isoform X1 [Ipomoea batatas]
MAASFTSSFASCMFSSILCTPSWRKSFGTSATVAQTCRRLVKIHQQSLGASSRIRSFSCALSASSDLKPASCTVSSNRPIKYERLLPCPSENFPPRVEHLVVMREGPVLEYISEALDLPQIYVADLIHFGAVYYALVCPKPPPTATSEQIKLYEEVTAPSVLKKRASVKGKTVREAQKTFRISSVHDIVEAGTYLRVHVHPKRFPRCYEIDWKSRIIAVAESYVVLDKPAGTSEKKVKKLYLALTAAPVPTGIITHYMRPINTAPRIVSEDFVKGWQICKLEVLECKKIPWPKSSIEREYSIENCGWPSKEFAYECKIDLLTGRTHQVY